ncbi:hypothetical protein ACH4KV_24250 [Streptomyces albidoflavus]
MGGSPELRTTVEGTPIEITYYAHSGVLNARCTTCPWEGAVRTGAFPTDPPEKEDCLIDRHFPHAVALAQAHSH